MKREEKKGLKYHLEGFIMLFFGPEKEKEEKPYPMTEESFDYRDEEPPEYGKKKIERDEHGQSPYYLVLRSDQQFVNQTISIF